MAEQASWERLRYLALRAGGMGERQARNRLVYEIQSGAWRTIQP